MNDRTHCRTFVNSGKILFLVASFRDTGVNPTDKKDNSRSGYTGVEEVEEVHQYENASSKAPRSNKRSAGPTRFSHRRRHITNRDFLNLFYLNFYNPRNGTCSYASSIQPRPGMLYDDGNWISLQNNLVCLMLIRILIWRGEDGIFPRRELNRSENIILFFIHAKTNPKISES